ncbi:MAG TPA: NTP transferase domain-containing protein [Magnetospirillaceae bacterium]|nr:NTP transferase domain-containing protein [Magnetospirillaceae bacterium]
MYDCVIPAAGASSRMGAWKPGLPFRGGTLLSSSAGIALRAGCRVLVVAGRNSGSIPGALGMFPDAAPCGSPSFEIVPNPNWELGMTGSLQAGMTRVSTRFFFVLPADMPFVPILAFQELAREAGIRAAGGLPEAPIFPVFRGESGHPVLVPAARIPEALRLHPAARFRDFLEGFGPVHIAVEDAGIRSDLDTMGEYESALVAPLAAEGAGGKAGDVPEAVIGRS